MKRLIVFAGLASLAACNQAEPAPEPTAEATEEAVPEVFTANGSAPGAYEATASDGTVTTSTLNADGSYTDTDAEGNVIAEGTWSVSNGKTCFAPTTEGAEAMCYAEGPAGADGSFTATPDSGDPVTVKPAPAPAAE